MNLWFKNEFWPQKHVFVAPFLPLRVLCACVCECSVQTFLLLYRITSSYYYIRHCIPLHWITKKKSCHIKSVHSKFLLRSSHLASFFLVTIFFCDPFELNTKICTVRLSHSINIAFVWCSLLKSLTHILHTTIHNVKATRMSRNRDRTKRVPYITLFSFSCFSCFAFSSSGSIE